MTPERAHLLAGLLDEMRTKDAGFIPDEAWLSVQATFAIPYVEVLILTKDSPPKFLLTYREDASWKGWHIPGGIWYTKYTQAEAVRSVARRELGIDVKFVAEAMTEKWADHPYGNPISHVCIAKAKEPIKETPKMRFFSNIPDGMIIHHRAFIERALEFESQRRDRADRDRKVRKFFGQK